jgi:hypothetical protein
LRNLYRIVDKIADDSAARFQQIDIGDEPSAPAEPEPSDALAVAERIANRRQRHALGKLADAKIDPKTLRAARKLNDEDDEPSDSAERFSLLELD